MHIQPPLPVYLTEQQVADTYHVGIRTLQRWRSTGEGPSFVRLGPRRVGYRLSDIEKWAADRTYAHHAEEYSRQVAR